MPNLCDLKRLTWGRSGVVVSMYCWTSDLKDSGLTPSPWHRVVSLNKKLYLTLSLSTQVCK